MLIATMGEKGGSGKSTLASHFVTAYFLKNNCEKSTERTLNLFEFDAHNLSAQDILNDHQITGQSIGNDSDKMIEAISSIEFQSFDQDVIIDVGGSDNTDRFLELIQGESFASEIVFIIPEMNKRPRSAENTVQKIRQVITEPKIIIALNRYSGDKPIKDEYKFFFGDQKIGVAASPLASDKKISVVAIPLCDVALGLAEISQISLWGLSENHREFGNMPLVEKREFWGTKNKEDGTIIPCTEEVFQAKTKDLHASKTAKTAIDKAQPLFDCLDTFKEA